MVVDVSLVFLSVCTFNRNIYERTFPMKDLKIRPPPPLLRTSIGSQREYLGQ